MATINNSQTLLELREASQLQQGKEPTPNILGDRIIPVMEVNPKLLRRCNIVRSNTTTGTAAVTVYTCPSNVDFYLTSASLTLAKDATCDVAAGSQSLIITPDGQAQTTVLRVNCVPTTAAANAVAINFEPPIKLQRSSLIQLGSYTFTVGAMSRAGCITGYTVENNGG